MSSPAVLLRGPGWRLPAPLELRNPLEIRAVASDRPGDLPELLAWLDGVAASGHTERIAAGFLTYEAGVALEGSVALFRPPATPLAWFGLFDTDTSPALRSRHSPLEGRPEREDVRNAPAERFATGIATDMDLAAWTIAVGVLREAIARGDVYQANLTRRTALELRVLPRRLADLLWNDNPVPFAICIETGQQAVVSNSPELFLDVDLHSRQVVSAPIKGTVPRLVAGSEEEARVALLASEKDAAEHLMIVDLIRNDLGRVCEAGSVHVPTFRAVRSFRHLHHLESTVAGTLRPETRLSDLLVATLPGGSITGAPKRAALGVIRSLEPVARGPYTGAAGFVRGDGKAVFNVAIRTALVDGGTVSYHAGGGIVWDSDPLLEWEETETKSREFFRALALAARESEAS
ncbi:MAG TPA: anthranilate synthase component I family protein [Thermoanaerobaculia bacterium]|nr:anthranilate synthase component I family protein [Thermoanaerobaculia bacterium]